MILILIVLPYAFIWSLHVWINAAKEIAGERYLPNMKQKQIKTFP